MTLTFPRHFHHYHVNTIFRLASPSHAAVVLSDSFVHDGTLAFTTYHEDPTLFAFICQTCVCATCIFLCLENKNSMYENIVGTLLCVSYNLGYTIGLKYLLIEEGECSTFYF